MKITRDVPGQRLTLERDPPRIPPGAPSFVLLVLSLPFLGYTLWSLPAAFAEGAETSQKIAAAVMMLFWTGLFLSTMRAMRARARWPTGLDVDRSSGELRLRESRLLGGVTPEAIVPLSHLDGLNVRRTFRAPSTHDPLRARKSGPGVAVAFRIRRQGGVEDAFETREMQFGVRDVDRVEEVADLALRLGAATGLSFFRIVRSDARDVEVDLRRGFETGFDPVPANLGRADYSRDAVSEPARSIARTETVPPFEPQGFRSDHRIATWSPGAEVRFRKPLSFAAIGCLPFTLLLLAGPAIFYFTGAVGGRDGSDMGSRVILSIVLGLFGLVFGTIAMVVVATSLPRTVLFDWTSRSVQFRTLTKSRAIRFEAVQAVELKPLHLLTTGKSPRHYYWCEVGLHSRDEASGALTYEALVATERMTDDPDTPYKMAIPLASDLAKALHVARRVSDYS